MKQNLRSIRFGTTAALALLAATCTLNLCAQQRQMPGALSGVVRDARGTPQMGAAVELLTPYAAEVAVALTDIRGRYRFTAVSPGHYALKVTAAAFLPTLRDNLQLRGGQAVVNLTLNTLFEAAQWVPAQRRTADESEEDWKWTLRSSVSRPILRWDEDGPTVVVRSHTAEGVQRRSLMHATVSSGTGEFASGGSHAALEAAGGDVGNGLWMVRSDMDQVRGSNAAAAFSAGLERQLAQGLTNTDLRTNATIRQLPGLSSGGSDAVRVATFVLRGAESTRLAGLTEIAAGSEMTIVQSTGSASNGATSNGSTGSTHRISSMRPFLTVRTNPEGKNGFAYRFASSPAYQGVNDVDATETLPRFAVEHGELVLEDASHNSFAFERRSGHSWLEAAVYSDHFSHPVISGSQATSSAVAGSGNAIVDNASQALRVAGRSYSSAGIHVGATEELAPELWATIEFSTGTALVLGPAPFRQARDLENAIASLTPQSANSAAVSLRGRLPGGGGTVWHAAYRWQPSGTLTPVDAFDNPSGDAYLSIYIRQPLYGRQNNVEAIFDIRNLLAEGYRPVLGADGRMVFLAQQPRTLRGGLAFTF